MRGNPCDFQSQNTIDILLLLLLSNWQRLLSRCDTALISLIAHQSTQNPEHDKA